MEDGESGHKDMPGTGEGRGIATLKQKWQKWAGDHREYQRSNPFSGSHVASSLEQCKAGEEYGRPKNGSKTEQRGRDAHRLVGREIEELLDIIKRNGESGPDGNICVTFGRLFDAYVTISNKVVGLLLRARKHGLIRFDGEMLWQGRDDHVLITLVE
ncbi:actin-binding Rho-activating protein-like [Amblyraja radiata]|uniref:actin-binding Rho-activating protein-like n=1 Tax=Amblyraja radiata TaxID=386614 RepID=UPI0014039470|nr:actin-binding Rho-activating protein-like [Amblyraja radiata]